MQKIRGSNIMVIFWIQSSFKRISHFLETISAVTSKS